ncbi:MAG: hypothetical protein ACI91T_002712 [Natronomonas sp.]|jgi:hypothetical protein
MKRRRLLKRMAALGGGGALAGCLETIPGSGDDDAGDGESTGTPTGNPTATPTEEPTPAVASETIETEGTDCMTGDQGASVSFETDRVVVDGKIQSPDPCHEATLETVEYDPDVDRLAVSVGVEAAGAEACQACLGVVEYRAEVGFDGTLPGHVTVEHVGADGEPTTITEASQ